MNKVEGLQAFVFSLPPLPASFFQVNEADRAWIDSMCTPQPLGTYTEKLVLTGARERIATFLNSEKIPAQTDSEAITWSAKASSSDPFKTGLAST